MKIFCLEVPGNHEWIMPVDPALHEVFFSLNGHRQTAWRKPAMEIIREREDGTRADFSDFPWMDSCAPVLRDRAVSILKDDLERYGQLLPLKCQEPVWLFNVTNILDALDEERSRIVRFEDGSIMHIEEHAFYPEIIADSVIFKLPLRASSTYVTEDFIKRLKQTDLGGIAFKLVWSDEPVFKDQEFVFLQSRRKSGVLNYFRRLFSDKG